MSFEVAAESYDAFMGRYSTLLAPPFADLASVLPGKTALDVGCGPGALTSELVRRLGAKAVAAVDPSESFVAATRSRLPGVDVCSGSTEQLPFEAATFDVTLAQLVFHFVKDPIAAARELARVTRKGGVVAANVWDFAGRRAPVSPFWDAAHELDPDVRNESALPGARAEDLGTYFRAAGLREVVSSELVVTVRHETFESWWRPFTLGVGPAGAYAQYVGSAHLSEIQKRCEATLGPGPFDLRAVAWASCAMA